MGTLLATLAARDPETLLVLDRAGAATRGQVVDTARRVASTLSGGAKSLQNARIAIFASPGRDFLHALLGVWHAGGCATVLSPLHPEPESRFFCADAGVRAILVTPDLAQRAMGLADVPIYDVTKLMSTRRLGPAIARPEDDALMLYTSGTTGKPKGAVLTHANLFAQTTLLETAWGFGAADVLLHALPLHHMHGLCIALMTALAAGAATRMLPAWDAAVVWETMRDSTVFMGVPTMYAKLLAAFDAADDPTRVRWTEHALSLRLATSGSAALPVTLAERWRAIAGAIPLERFGMTEIGVGITNTLDPARRKPGRVGTPLPTVEVRVVDEQGQESTQGELQIRGPSVFRGYHGREQATREAFVDGGWFRTGDTVLREDDGTFRILGRTSVDILKSGGYKLSALEIEEALREHPAVAEVAVIGVPDETWGERVVACVVQRADVTEQELRDFAKKTLASYKCPKDVVFMKQLPKNAMGKVQKPELLASLHRQS